MKWFMMIVLVLFVSMVKAQTYVWEPSNEDGNWHTHYNWNPCGVPKETDDVIISGLVCNIFKPAHANSITIGNEDAEKSGYLNIRPSGELYAHRITLGKHRTEFGLLALLGKDTLLEVDEFIIGDRGNGSLVMYGGMVLAKEVRLHGIIDCSWGTLKTNALQTTDASLIVLRRGIICGYEYHPLDIYEDSDWIINYKDLAVLAEHWLERQ